VKWTNTLAYLSTEM